MSTTLKSPSRLLSESDIQEMIEVRRDLHAHPETAFQEVRTSGFVAARRSALERVPIRADHVYGDYCIDFLHRACRSGLRVVEVPYACVDRRAGTPREKDGGTPPPLKQAQGASEAEVVATLKADAEDDRAIAGLMRVKGQR